MKRTIAVVIMLSLVLSLLASICFAEENGEEQTIEINGQIIKINPEGTARGTSGAQDESPKEGFRKENLFWKDMIYLTTEVPSDWPREKAITGWQQGFTFSNNKVLMFYFYADIQNIIDRGLPENSDSLIDALLTECIGTRLNIGGYHHITLAHRKAGYCLMFDSDNTPCLFFTILNGSHALFLSVTDLDGFADETTLNIILHSLLTLEFTDLETYPQAINGYAKATMEWTGMKFKATTEVPSDWKMKVRKQGWQQGYSLYKDETMLLNLFYFYAKVDSLYTDDIVNNPNKMLDALFSNALSAKSHEVNYVSYSGHEAGQAELTFDNGASGILVILLNGNYALYLLAEISSNINYDQAVENIINHSLESLVFYEIE